MDPAKIKAVRRGKFDQLTYDGKKIEIQFKNVKIVRDMYSIKSDRCAYNTFVRIDLTHALGNKGDLLLIHNYVKAKSATEFSPLKYAADNKSWSDIVCKIKTDTYLNAGDIIDDVILSPGAFGSWGWVLTMTKK